MSVVMMKRKGFDMLIMRDTTAPRSYFAGDRWAFAEAMRVYEHAGRYFMTQSPLATLIQIYPC